MITKHDQIFLCTLRIQETFIYKQLILPEYSPQQTISTQNHSWAFYLKSHSTHNMGAQATRLAVPELKVSTPCNTALVPDEMSKWMLDCMHEQLKIDQAKADKAKADKANADELQPDELEAVKSKAARDARKRKSTEMEEEHHTDHHAVNHRNHHVKVKRQRVEMPTIPEEPEEL